MPREDFVVGGAVVISCLWAAYLTSSCVSVQHVEVGGLLVRKNGSQVNHPRFSTYANAVDRTCRSWVRLDVKGETSADGTKSTASS